VNETTSPNLEAALAYARRGWPVFPLHSVQEGCCSCGRPACESAAKHPRTLHGLKDATRDEAQIRLWWNTWPDANVGIVTGTQSGLVVVDIDPRNGGDESLAELERTHGSLPKTIESLTGGGGQHFFFQHPGGSIKSKPLAEGIDIKADGGYVVAPPSSHRSGELYRWEGAGHPEDVPPAALPGWLCAQLTRGPEYPSKPSAGASSEKIHAGQRNKTLTSLAGAMRRQGADEATILHTLRAHNRQCCDPPLLALEVNRIAGSIAKYP
jgi:putative DNA primase/helicase